MTDKQCSGGCGFTVVCTAYRFLRSMTDVCRHLWDRADKFNLYPGSKVLFSVHGVEHNNRRNCTGGTQQQGLLSHPVPCTVLLRAVLTELGLQGAETNVRHECDDGTPSFVF